MKQEDLLKALEAIGKSGIKVAGDLVLEKHVEHEVANVEPGGIGIQINNGNTPEVTSSGKATTGEVPERLNTEEAEELMENLVDAGMLTDDWQPDGLSGTERALVAKAVCDRLEVNEVWQLFGQLWGEKPETLRAYYNKAMEQKKSLKFQDRLKNILD
jgi:hypothetical protein